MLCSSIQPFIRYLQILAKYLIFIAKYIDNFTNPC